jgi:hypothetical protein
MGLALFEQDRARVQREAEVQASLRLLAEFHRTYLAERGVPLVDYRKKMEAFSTAHPGWEYLELYQRNAAAD